MFAHHSQSHAAAFDLVPWFEGLKHSENLLVVLRRDSRTVVFDTKTEHGAKVLDGNFDFSRVLVMVLDGVGDQVNQNLLQRHTENLDARENGGSRDKKAFWRRKQPHDVLHQDCAGFAAKSCSRVCQVSNFQPDPLQST